MPKIGVVIKNPDSSKEDYVKPSFITRTIHFDWGDMTFGPGISLIWNEVLKGDWACSLDGCYVPNHTFRLGVTFVFKDIPTEFATPLLYIYPFGLSEVIGLSGHYILDVPSFFKEQEVRCSQLNRSDIDYVILHVTEENIIQKAEENIERLEKEKSIWSQNLIKRLRHKAERCIKTIRYIKENFDVKAELKPSRFRQLVLEKQPVIEELERQMAGAKNVEGKIAILDKIIEEYKLIGLGVCKVFGIDWDDAVKRARSLAEHEYRKRFSETE